MGFVATHSAAIFTVARHAFRRYAQLLVFVELGVAAAVVISRR